MLSKEKSTHWEFGLSAWDLAAGALLVREAGGLISDFTGGNSYLSRGYIIAAAPVTFPLLLIISIAFLYAVDDILVPGMDNNVLINI